MQSSLFTVGFRARHLQIKAYKVKPRWALCSLWHLHCWRFWHVLFQRCAHIHERDLIRWVGFSSLSELFTAVEVFFCWCIIGKSASHWNHWCFSRATSDVLSSSFKFYIPKPFRAPDHSWPTFRVLLMCLCQAFSIKAIGDKIFHPPKAEVGHSTVCTRLIPFVLWQMLLNRDPYQNLWHYDFFAEAEETEVELFSDEEVEVLHSVLFESFWTLQFFIHLLNS